MKVGILLIQLLSLNTVCLLSTQVMVDEVLKKKSDFSTLRNLELSQTHLTKIIHKRNKQVYYHMENMPLGEPQ